MSPKWLSNIINPPSSIPIKARIDLTANEGKYALGEQLKGKVKIVSDEEFIVDQAVVCLNCHENIKKTRIYGNQYATNQTEYWDSAITYSTFFKLFGAATIPQGFCGSYEYLLNISPAAKETLYTIDHYVKWLFYATLQVRGRPNLQTINYEIQVVKPQINPSAPAVMKEITREVVLIPCTYCSGLMPQTSIFCPNCGARRKG
jgi:hypothetical protein